MAVRQEAPVRRGPIIKAPEKKKKGHPAGRIIGSAILAGSIGFVALGGYEIYTNTQKSNPEPTPISGGMGEPTPITTPQTTIFISPSPEITQSPTPEPSPTPDTRNWWEKIPENPYKDIDVNKIPLPKDSYGFDREGLINTTYVPFKPYYALEIHGGTIIAVIPDVKNNLAWVELATSKPGERIIKETCNTGYVALGEGPITFCKYSNATLWLYINNKTFLYNWRASERLGQGLESAAEYLRVGDRISADITFGNNENILNTPTDLNRNLKSWNNLKNSVGKSIPRTTKPNMNFSFHPGDIFVDK